MNYATFEYFMAAKETIGDGLKDYSLSWGARGLFHIMIGSFAGIRLPIGLLLNLSSDDEAETRKLLEELIGKGYVEHCSQVMDISNFGENLGK